MKIHSWILLFIFSFAGVVSASAQWITDYQAALQKAQAEDKAILINFTGSDWCGWCIKLKDEVFDKAEFKQFANENLVLLEIDFPKRKPQSATVRAANEKLAGQFRIKGFPTVYLVDKTGKKLLQTGYVAGGPKNYIANLKKSHDFGSQGPSSATANTHPPSPVAAKKPEIFAYAVVVPVIKYDELALKGISNGRTKMALINNQSLATGEKGRVQVADRMIEIQVKEIQEKSVIVQISGETTPRELVLKNPPAAGN